MASLSDAILELRGQGLPDTLVVQELVNQGYPQEQVQAALAGFDAQDESSIPSPPGSAGSGGYGGGYGGSYPSQPSYGVPSSPSAGGMSGMGGRGDSGIGDGNIYERIEEITENIIDEKWEELLAEVRKIVSWKEKVEEKQAKLANDVEKLKEDFDVLHQGVLGKLEDYDDRMQDVGTELKAVGKVFKDVIPEFVQNVKDLSSLKSEWKGELKGKN
ncbi:hypothetical protein HYX13_04260 [Candidatus Woesearchaeota archaeon]|nr:hypothetical protein [Candidatus Woesearchaeota archaeon]